MSVDGISALHITEHVHIDPELVQLKADGERVAREIQALHEKIGGIGMTPKPMRAMRLAVWRAEISLKRVELKALKKAFDEKKRSLQKR